MRPGILITLLLVATYASGPQIHAAESVAPFVPTVTEDVELLLDLADVGAGDYLIDLGSGDGRIVIAAAQRGAMAHGVELEPDLVDLARQRARDAEVDDRAAFVRGDIFDADISGATVVTLYLWPDANLRLRPKLLAELAPGTRIVSNAFDMGDWEPDAMAQGRTSGGAMLWIVPSDVHGRWLVTIDGEPLTLDIRQRYQHLDATLTRTLDEFVVEHAMLRGDRIRVSAQGNESRYVLAGQIEQNGMSGYAHVRNSDAATVTAWSAFRDTGGR